MMRQRCLIILIIVTLALTSVFCSYPVHAQSFPIYEADFTTSDQGWAAGHCCSTSYNFAAYGGGGWHSFDDGTNSLLTIQSEGSLHTATMNSMEIVGYAATTLNLTVEVNGNSSAYISNYFDSSAIWDTGTVGPGGYDITISGSGPIAATDVRITTNVAFFRTSGNFIYDVKIFGVSSDTPTPTPTDTPTFTPTSTAQLGSMLDTPFVSVFSVCNFPTATGAPTSTPPAVIPTSGLQSQNLESLVIPSTPLITTGTPVPTETPTGTFVTLTPTGTPTCTPSTDFSSGTPAVTLPDLTTGMETCYVIVPSVNQDFGPLVIPVINVTLVPAININFPGAQVCVSTFSLAFSIFGIDFSTWITAFLSLAGIGMAWNLLRSTL